MLKTFKLTGEMIIPPQGPTTRKGRILEVALGIAIMAAITYLIVLPGLPTLING
jgi:hypothetical protein